MYRENESQFREALKNASREELEKAVFNEEYNSFCGDCADSKDGGKVIPYMGWFWRSCDFYGKWIPIGTDGDFVGVMCSNKWDYEERELTPEEYEVFMSHLDNAMQESRKGGDLDEIHSNVKKHLSLLSEWLQTLQI